MAGVKAIQDAVGADGVVVGTWPSSGEPRGVLVMVDDRCWMVYRDETFGLGWAVCLVGPSGVPVTGSELWLPLVPGETDVPGTWWRRFCDATCPLPERWNGHTPPSPASSRSGSDDATPRLSFVVAANRLPVEVTASAPPWTTSTQWHTSPGGLVAAVEPVVQRHGGGWVGWSGGVDHHEDPFDRNGMHLLPVTLSADEVQRFYDGFSNATLWPLYHDVIAEPYFDESWWETYRRINQRFADTAASRAALRATVWVHDYQLQLVPAMLRATRPDLRIGYFHHIPFPGPEIFAQLPWRKQVLEGLLGADALGFQRNTDASNFVQACRRWLPAASVEMSPTGKAPTATVTQPPRAASARTVRVGAFPISIDVGCFADLVQRPDVQSRARQIRDELGAPEILMLAVDRMDYTKGILHRLDAYESLLRDGVIGPEQAVLVQVATPTRERVARYQQLVEQVGTMVGRINGEYGTLGRPAVRYLHHSYPKEELAALYLAADIMLVSSLRDGMNLVAKEYVACRADDSGVLVLSEFTGAADEFRATLLFNPHDRRAAQQAIADAIKMPKAEATERMRELRTHLRDHDVHQWASTFLTFLRQGDAASPRSTAKSPPSAGPVPRQRFEPADPRLNCDHGLGVAGRHGRG